MPNLIKANRQSMQFGVLLISVGWIIFLHDIKQMWFVQYIFIDLSS